MNWGLFSLSLHASHLIWTDYSYSYCTVQLDCCVYCVLVSMYPDCEQILEKSMSVCPYKKHQSQQINKHRDVEMYST